MGMDNHKYLDVMNRIKKTMMEEKMLPGDKLPSENMLSAKYSVSRETIRKALALLEQEGLVFPVHGKGTFCAKSIKESSKNVAVITTYITDYIFPSVIQGIDDELTKQGYSILLKNTKNSRTMEGKCLEEILQKDVEGIIIEPSKSHIFCRNLDLFKKLDEQRIPYVFIQGTYFPLDDKPYVLLDDRLGGYLITKYLIESGHKNIAGVFKSDDVQGQNRHKGYVEALQDAGMKYNPDYVVWFYTEDRAIHPYEGIKKLLDEKPQIDSIVCYNDQIALKVMRVLEEIGKRIPEDISVTGYDNSALASNSPLRLTTVAHPQNVLGETAARLLLDLLSKTEEERETINTHIMIKPEIIEGDTCKAR